MKFYSYIDAYRKFRKLVRERVGEDIETEDFYASRMENIERFIPDSKSGEPDLIRSIMQAATMFERDWVKLDRPYYNVYPALISSLLKLDLAGVPHSSLKRPSGLTTLICNLPENQYIVQGKRPLRNVAVSCGAIKHTSGSELLMIAYYDQEEQTLPGYDDVMACEPVWNILFFPLAEVEGMSIQESVDDAVARYCDTFAHEVEAGVELAADRVVCPDGKSYLLVEFAVKLAVMVCLLGDDPELIKPDVLSRDAMKLTPENAGKLQEKAKKRGKFGWTLGKEMESTPHFRRPHPAWYWVGEGRKRREIRFRAGAVVHRKKLLDIPTGFDSEG